MRGSVYQRCSCRDPVTRRPLGAKCPKLRDKGHALGWFYRYSLPRLPGEKRRRPEAGPFRTKKAAEEALADELARLGRGGRASDRSELTAPYLENWLAAKKLRLKPSTYQSYEEAVRLYFKPGVGHFRLVDLREHHLQDLVGAMLQLNRPLPDGEKPSELLKRLVAARADDERRQLPEGEKRGKKSVKPLSPARIEREFAVIRAALNSAVPRKITVNPCDGVELPRVEKVRPLAWTPKREAAFRAAADTRIRDAEAAAEREQRVLTSVERQELWAAADLRPCPVMVWLPSHTGAFLDFIEGERFAALFTLAAYVGLRRDEVCGLTWAEVDLEDGVAFVRETGSGSGPKSDAGVRAVPLAALVVQALKAWRKVQAADRLAFGPDWPLTDRVFTREDGTDVPGQWVSVRFELLAFRAGLPPVRFHDLRHGAASLAKAAGQDDKYISALLGHSKTWFTSDTYVHLFPAVMSAAAEASAAIVPRRRPAQGGGQSS
jgi:integrase